MTAFSPQSLLIGVEADVPGRIEMLTKPSAYEPRVSRKVFHEVLHYWQLVSRPYLWSMAGEDLARLEHFEATGGVTPPGPLRAGFTAVDESLGFSAESMHEAVARYWDVHVLGPHVLLRLEHDDPDRRWSDDVTERYLAARDAGQLTRADGSYSHVAFELAMDAAAGTYAAPYQLVRSVEGSRRAAVLFPLVGLLAFWSRRPTWAFQHLLAACRDLELDGDDIHELWASAWSPVCARAADLLVELGEALDLDRLGIPGAPEPAGPVHEWLAARWRASLAGLAEDPATVDAGSRLALQFAAVGDPSARGFLLSRIPPAMVRLGQETVWLPACDLPEDAPGRQSMAEADRLVERIDDLQRRVRAFVRASVLAGLPSAPAVRLDSQHAIADTVDAVLRVTGRRDERGVSWLLEVLSGVADGEFGRFCGRHLRGVLAPGDAQTAMAEIASLVSNARPLTVYDSGRGAERAWSSSVAELVLATAALMLSARDVGNRHYTDITAALHLRVLEWLEDRPGAVAPPLDQLLAARAGQLRSLVPADAKAAVDLLVEQQREEDR